MNSLALQNKVIPAMADEDIAKVRRLEDFILSDCPPTDIDHTHTLHSGVYTRSITIPAGVVLTGALIKIPTTLIVSGECVVFIGDKTFDVNGYHVFVAAAGRKQAFVAKSDTVLTMIFATDASTVEEAEQEFTDEHSRLMSRNGKNFVMVGV